LEEVRRRARSAALGDGIDIIASDDIVERDRGKGGGFYGWKLHLAVCARTELPVAWCVETARAHHESSLADHLLQRVRERRFQPETTTLDKGHDVGPVCPASVEIRMRCSPTKLPPVSSPF